MDLKCRDHIYLEPVCPQVLYQRFAYLHFNNFMKIYLLQSVSQMMTSLRFLILLKFNDFLIMLLKKMFLKEKK